MILKEITASSIITKSNLPDADYVINPYVGCNHACIYCYACFMKKFTGHNEEWGKFVDVKINSPELIPSNSTKYRGKSIFMSSVTDPYLPYEKKYGLTRKIIERLIPLQPNLCVQTKSDLILRDIDLISQFEGAEVGVTITTLDDKIRKEIEPYTATVENRIKVLREFKAQGIKTYVFIGPILPYITDWESIVETTKDFADSYLFENLNISGVIWNGVKRWLKVNHPDLLRKYENIYFTRNEYWDIVENQIDKFGKENGIDYKIYFHHNK